MHDAANAVGPTPSPTPTQWAAVESPGELHCLAHLSSEESPGAEHADSIRNSDSVNS
jgi:hypothetical protein